MAKPRLAPVIAGDDYPALKRLIGDDKHFPDSYDEWLAKQKADNAGLEAEGVPLVEVIITSADIAEYCRSIGEKPSWATFGAALVAKNARQR